MKNAETILLKMEALLIELNSVAIQLCTDSNASISRKDLATLQSRQNELMGQLIEADIAFTKETQEEAENYTSPSRTRVKKLLQDFQSLNSSFIDNIKDTSGIIKFHHRSKREKHS